MALKPDRSTESTDISYFVNSITGPNSSRMERGGVLCAHTGTPGSGAGMDSAAQLAVYLDNPSGFQALGILMNDFVNLDQSRQILNWYKDEAQVGTKAVILKRGWVVTNNIAANAATGSMPTVAYAGTSGNITSFSGAGLPILGRFLTRPDAEGYAKVEISIPN